MDISIDAASIDTGVADRDSHLRSPDFLDTEQYPTLNFQSTKVELTDDNSAKLFGNLTIRITNPIVLDVEYAGKSKNPWGQTIAGFSGKTKIKRSNWNLVWNAILETGGVAVSDDVTIEIELEVVQQFFFEANNRAYGGAIEAPDTRYMRYFSLSGSAL